MSTTPAAAAPPTYLTVTEVAAELRVSRMTIYRMLEAGDLPGVRIGRSLRVSREGLSAYLAAHAPTAHPPQAT